MSTLNLSRRVGESFYINDNVIVTIVAIQGHLVRVAIEAPPEIRILRDELKARDAHKSAAEPTPPAALRVTYRKRRNRFLGQPGD